MTGEGVLEDGEQALRGAQAASDAANAAPRQAVIAKRKRDDESSEERRRASADAEEAAAELIEDAEAEIAEIRRALRAERAALDAEKAAMEKTYTFQTKKTLLDVGGHKFTTSLPTLTSVPNTYLEAMFSGRYPLVAGADGEFFIDRPLPPHPQLPA